MNRLPELKDALQDLSEQHNQRLIVLDRQLHVVAYSMHETPADRARLSYVLAHSDSWSAPVNETIALPGHGQLQAIRLLDSSRHVIGYVLGQLPPTAVDRLARLLETVQRHDGHRQAFAFELTAGVVTGAQPAPLLIDERLLSTAPSYCAVAVGACPDSDGTLRHDSATRAVTETLDYVRKTSTATVVGSVLEDGRGALVFPRPVVVARLSKILGHVELQGVRAGIGPLLPLEQIPASFHKATLALRASWRAPSDYEQVTAWEDTGVDGTLARLPVEEFTLDDLPAAAEVLLRGIPDQELIHSLETYLRCGGDAKRTATALHIHRSTLYYRLEKLRPFLSGDLADGTFRHELFLGLRLATLAGLR